MLEVVWLVFIVITLLVLAVIYRHLGRALQRQKGKHHGR